MRKLKPAGLHHQVIEEIGRRIVAGEYPAAEPLPPEKQLCESLGVSRTALREAMRVLASKGLVEPKRKVGTSVRSPEHWNFLDAGVLSWQLEGADSVGVIDELYELRHLLEPLAASLAALRARASDIDLLRQAYEDMRAAGDDGAKIAEPDLRFHQGIIAASGNRFFSSLTHVIGAALEVNFKLVREARHGHSMPAHKKVLDAIVGHEPYTARLAMQRLIEDSQQEAKALRTKRRLERKA